VSSQHCDLCPSGKVANATDCNDGDFKIKPGAPEIQADSVDQDCNGKEICFIDADKDGHRTETTIESSNGACASVDGEAVATSETDCDDGNAGIQKVCQLSAGSLHTCAILNGGRVRCWGAGGEGRLGYAAIAPIGDNETPGSAGDVNVGGFVTQISAGTEHTCALLKDATVRCWGSNDFGRLGYSNVAWIGDNEHPAMQAVVDVGGNVLGVSTGQYHTCALLSSGKVRCWGRGLSLGYGNENSVSTPSTAGDLIIGSLGTTVASLSVGAKALHSCAVLNDGKLQCWGLNGSGQLGYGHTNIIGDGENPSSAGYVDVGGVVTQVSVGGGTCALLQGGKVRCWGSGSSGMLGYAGTDNIGDTETPASKGDVDVGGVATQISMGGSHTCALLSGGKVRCWGSGLSGRLGYGGVDNIGDTETPASKGDVDVGGTVVQIAAGGSHTCALLTGSRVRCWGSSVNGELGYGNTNSIGDNETPASAGDVPLF